MKTDNPKFIVLLNIHRCLLSNLRRYIEIVFKARGFNLRNSRKIRMTWMNHQKTVEIKNSAAQKHEKICYLILSTLDIVNQSHCISVLRCDVNKLFAIKTFPPII